MSKKPLYKTILLKLSGEALLGKQNHGIDAEICASFASQIKGTHKTGFNEIKAYDMYNERMDKFSKLPPIMGQRAAPSAANMGPPADGGAGEA